MYAVSYQGSKTAAHPWPVPHVDGLMQKRHNSFALAMELHLSCTNPSICSLIHYVFLHYFSACRSSMKVKEIDRTANVAWSPSTQYPIYLAAATAAQQLDATFRSAHKISALGQGYKVDSLAPGRYHNNFKSIIFIIRKCHLGTYCEIALRWMPHNLTIQKSTLVQVMAWCHQATSH